MATRLPLFILALALPFLPLINGEASSTAQNKEEIYRIGTHLMPIEPGTFYMGLPRDLEDDPKEPSERKETGRIDEEGHEVRITKGFHMLKYEVTQEEYTAVMKVKNPSHFAGEKLPVEKVSWHDAKEFCRKLSMLEGKKYTLPTEAEWEYACRAGANTAFNFGPIASADKFNYDARKVFPQRSGKVGEFRDKTMPVGSFEPNKWGLHDMHGNVWEWCEDWYTLGYYRVSPKDDPKGPDDGSTRVLRGGAWFYEPTYCRSAYRTGFRPEVKSYSIGFRVVLRNAK